MGPLKNMPDLLQIRATKTSYKAGDPVLGSVYLTNTGGPAQDIDVESISITFTGRLLTTRHWPRHPQSIQLFAYKEILLLGPRTLRVPSITFNDQQNWPFTFNFPVDCNTTQYDGPPAPPFSLFNTDHNQPLPPSLSTCSNESNPSEAVSIVYELQATLLSPSTIKYLTAQYTTRLELDLDVPRNTEQLGLECTNKLQRITCQTLDLYPEEHRELAKRPLRLTEKLGMKSVSTGHLPKAVFDVKLQTLSSAIVGQPLSVFLYINYDPASSTIRAPPPVYVKKVAVWLREDTSMLVPKGVLVAGNPDQIGWAKTSQLAVRDFNKDLPLVNGFLDMRRILDLTLKDDLIPTFKTFNIARSYGTKVYVTLECARKTFFIHGFYKPCTLLAKHSDPEVPRYVQPAGPVLIMNETDDPPPPYELVEQAATQSQPSTSSQQSRRNGRHHGGLNIIQTMVSDGGGGIGGGGG